MFLIATVLGCRKAHPEKPSAQYTLDKHHELSHMLSSQYHDRRIVPLSSVKSHTVSHRRNKKAVPNIQDSDVCLPNGLQYAYFDKSQGACTSVCGSTEDVIRKCMYRMPNNSKSLECFMNRLPSGPDGIQLNEVIANLSDCPPHFSIDEYKNFGALPLGRSIIYHNILAQLALPAVDFTKAETHTLLLQVIEQTGTPNIGWSRDIGLHAAVLENWADFRPAAGAHWNILSGPHEHWVYIKSGLLTVYFDLLNAQLLVDGLPLARLPAEFMRHSVYLPLFGKSTLAVAPTDRPGMQFSAKSTYRDCKLHFGMEGPDMCVVAINGNSVFDLLPSRLFKDRVPTAFVDNYVHWYDHDKYEVIFCSRKTPWSFTGAEWRLVRQGPGGRLHHVLVNINKGESHKVYAYSLDTTLGRVVGSGEVQQSLFLALLHALTSHCLPDILTGYTGTESALNILQSAAVRSFEFLTTDNVDILHQIAALSPLRCFYPRELMEMKQIIWDVDLPSLSQHPKYRMCAEDIVRQAQTMQLFHPDKMPDTQRWKTSSPHLEVRDAIRSSTFRVYGFGAEQFRASDDVHYAARDVYTQSDRGQRAYIAATLIIRSQIAPHSRILDFKDRLLQIHFKGACVQGVGHTFESSTLRFDSEWLGDLATITREKWCEFHYHLPALSATSNKYDIVAWLSTMAFAKSTDMQVLQAFALFYRLQTRATVSIPSAPEFDLSNGSVLKINEIEAAIRNACKNYDESDEAELPKQGSETSNQHINRISGLFQSRQNIAIEAFVAEVKRQWPIAKPSAPTTSGISTYIDVGTAMYRITAKFDTWFSNRQFVDYLQQTSLLISSQRSLAIQSPLPQHSVPPKKQHQAKGAKNMFDIERIFAAVPPAALSPPREPKIHIDDQNVLFQSAQMKLRLEGLCQSLQSLARSKCEEDYVAELRGSCTALEDLQSSNSVLLNSGLSNGFQTLFNTYLKECKDYLEAMNLALAQAIADNKSPSDEIGLKLQYSPRISPTLWLSQLHRDRFNTLPEPWKAILIEYGLAITQLHRAQRLAAVSTTPADLMEELGHVGHSNWDSWEFPETLLFEAESGILIRREQEFIASKMRNAEDAMNIVLQLLMGGGKSSTIVPMLAAYLADRKKLVRIIIAKPQSKQMLHMLVSKLGYLLNRRVYHLPFSRSLRPNTEQASLIRKTYEECIVNRGVLLIQPEHILSFKLMAVEAKLAGQACANSLLETQEFFDDVSRDIIDESDENFSVKFELIYTMGTQRPIEFAPERWLVMQAIMGLVPRFTKQIWEQSPQSVELQRDEKGRFARVRVLHNAAAEELMLLVAKHIVEFGIIGLPTSSQSPDTQAALLRYITQSEPTAEEIRAVEGSKFWTDATKSPLLLVRGLIAGGVLRFALSTKRWRVNFGLDPSRSPETLLAVPFRSKDCPSPRSEFSHPDVVILLTLLSYYYGGLTDEQLFGSFTHLLKSDQAGIYYDEWVDTASPDLPVAFQQLSGVSIKDHHQCVVEVFPSLRYSKKAIDYYLSFLVFPKAMKEFPQKLSASGWDIGAIKAHPVTGFSGTNDTLHLLPLAVKHLDLPSQSHTNALVLQYLLQDETSVELLPPRTGGTDAQHLLSVIVGMQPEVRVILDRGASILEQNNQQVAEAWLNMCNGSIQAVVFFADEELSVLDRAGRIESLQTSPFAKQLDACLVYLDEAHTRGTDLKLARNYRAAVTLGQGLVKDKLTQGCMRMRKLGFGQSVAFIVPEEISTKIQERTGKPSHAPIEVSDVLCWSIAETWQDLKRSMPLWAVQGERFERNKNLLCGTDTSNGQAQAFLEDEAQTLEARYMPRTQDSGGMGMLKNWDLNNQNIAKIVTRCREFEAMGFSAATLSEEQERELAPEIEEERQIERPARLDAIKHTVHADLQRLVLSGKLTVGSKAFGPTFQALGTTSAARLCDLWKFPTGLLVTADFIRTVKPPAGSSMAAFISDSYQRPVQFVLSVYDDHGTVQNLLIISPVETNILLASIRKFAKVTLHLFAPRANIGFAPLDRLELYNVGRTFSRNLVSRSLTVQLNLFAGSLYLRDFNEYTELCDLLGLLRAKPVHGQQVYADGFIDPPTGTWGLTKSPVPFLRMFLVKIRREGEGLEKTHLGKILNGIRLEEADFRIDTEMPGT
ncbi:hypothetical protein CC86DRAFT_461565 [Ophiobolus disseminans]|uniref:ubiquitinyl hydrolase 1 n=1 Tax=Ophiobolus disseminans TaxID=1469910 RepID=A0A6A7AJI3_9PLEO|nr:hypothetical protein CC86DRAFT_461565 [Ophiobolus disseminans]